VALLLHSFVFLIPANEATDREQMLPDFLRCLIELVLVGANRPFKPRRPDSLGEGLDYVTLAKLLMCQSLVEGVEGPDPAVVARIHSF